MCTFSSHKPLTEEEIKDRLLDSITQTVAFADREGFSIKSLSIGISAFRILSKEPINSYELSTHFGKVKLVE